MQAEHLKVGENAVGMKGAPAVDQIAKDGNTITNNQYDEL